MVEQRWRGYLALGIWSFLIAFLVSYLKSTTPVQATSIMPFVAHRIELSYPPGAGRSPEVSDVVFARRSDGSWSRRYTSHSRFAGPVDVLEYADLRTMRSVHTEPLTQSVLTFAISASEVAGQISAGVAGCDGSESRGRNRKSVLGHEVVEVSRRDSEGTQVEFVAPALDCYSLQKTYTSASGARNEETVTSITRGEPPDSMFEIPPGLTERSPREIQALWASRFGQEYMPEKQLILVSQRYYSKH